MKMEKDVYNVSMEQLGYSLDQDTLKKCAGNIETGEKRDI